VARETDQEVVPGRRREVMVVLPGLMLAIMLAMLDNMIVGTAMPRIVGELGGVDHLSWVVTAYVLGTTVSTPLWGKIGDLYGRKNIFLTSIVIFLVTTASGARQRNVLSWLIGDLSGESRLLFPVAVFVLIGIGSVYINARSLNLMMIGEQDAFALGVETRRVKIAVYLAASLLTGAAVAVSGAIGFVGLIIPHAVRLVGGSDNRLVIPASALVGGAFLMLADTIARTVVAPRELNIGVITSIVGAPVFVYLLRRTN